MTFRLSDEERGIVLQTLKARLDTLHTEMTPLGKTAENELHVDYPRSFLCVFSMFP
jgi:hypothetical protein